MCVCVCVCVCVCSSMCACDWHDCASCVTKVGVHHGDVLRTHENVGLYRMKGIVKKIL